VKTYRDLYPQVCSFDNLYLGYLAARKGKRGKEPVASFEHRFEEKLLRLQEELESKTYKPGRYHNFYIHRPKRRKISAAPFRDRVMHHALCRVIEPIFERRFIHDSYACRIGKGTHRALDRCTEFARQKRYVLKCDIVQFFPSIDHQILRGLLARHIADEDALWLIDRILESGAGLLADEYEMHWFPGDDLLARLRPRGLPIGNLTSQFWANVYLNQLDHFVKRELGCRHYIRYVDDFLLFGDDKGELHHWRHQIMGFLVSMRLRLHEQQSVVFPVTTGIPFLGMRVYPTHRRLKKANALGFRRHLKELVERYCTGQIDFERLQASVQGWVNHARYADTWALRRSFFSTLVIPGGKE
jgi:RNA-directed DNA polymerase